MPMRRCGDLKVCVWETEPGVWRATLNDAGVCYIHYLDFRIKDQRASADEAVDAAALQALEYFATPEAWGGVFAPGSPKWADLEPRLEKADGRFVVRPTGFVL